MSRPRIVRESRLVSPFGYRYLTEREAGLAYLALPWPKACPYTPEAVMAACERHNLILDSAAKPSVDDIWWVRVTSKPGHSGWIEALTPDFVGEPKKNRKCPHPHIRYMDSNLNVIPSVECSCGEPLTILSDRRVGEPERRRVCLSGYTHTSGRRTGKGDRRKP